MENTDTYSRNDINAWKWYWANWKLNRKHWKTFLYEEQFKLNTCHLFLRYSFAKVMEDKNLGVETLSEAALNRLGYMLDNLECGWRQLAKAVAEQPQFCYR